jgi:hypothetical protein
MADYSSVWTWLRERWKRLSPIGVRGVAPLCAKAYFEIVYPEFRFLTPTAAVRATEEWKVAEQTVKAYQERPAELTNAGVLLFDRAVARILAADPANHALLRKKAAQLRERYQQVASEPDFARFAEVNKPLADGADIKLVVAEIEGLLSRFHQVYAIAPLRETVRNTLSVKIVNRMTVLLLLGFVLVLWAREENEPATAVKAGAVKATAKEGAPGAAQNQPPAPEAPERGTLGSLREIPSLLVIIFAGALGGFLSVQQRIQSAPTDGDAIQRMLALESGGFGVYISPILGAIFAILFYLLIIAGYMPQTDLLPTISTTPPPLGSFTLEEFLRACGPATSKDYAKLIVWSFLVGFAERLVPDALKRLSAQPPKGAK